MKNKKSLIFVLLAMLSVTAAFAAGSDAYVVKSITGTVKYESAPGKEVKVTEGQKLSPSTVIKTYLNSSVVLTSVADSSDVKISANKNGTVETLVKEASSVAKGGLNKRTSSSKSNVADAADGKDANVLTASSRASKAADNSLELDEDD